MVIGKHIRVWDGGLVANWGYQRSKAWERSLLEEMFKRFLSIHVASNVIDWTHSNRYTNHIYDPDGEMAIFNQDIDARTIHVFIIKNYYLCKLMPSKNPFRGRNVKIKLEIRGNIRRHIKSRLRWRSILNWWQWKTIRLSRGGRRDKTFHWRTRHRFVGRRSIVRIRMLLDWREEIKIYLSRWHRRDERGRLHW